MSPRTTSLTTALATTAAAFALAGCTSIPGITISAPTPTPTESPATSTPAEATPSSRPSRTTHSPRPSATSSPRATTSPSPGSDDEIKNGYVPRSSVEVQINRAAREQLGSSVSSSCPRDLEARVGATLTCTVKYVSGGQRADEQVLVTVTAIEGQRVRFNLKRA